MNRIYLVLAVALLALSACQNTGLGTNTPGNSPAGGGGGGGGLCPTGPMTCVNLTWNASTTPSVRYHIYMGTVSGGPYNPPFDAGPNLSYQVTGLTTGTYYFVATAYDSSGNESVYSNQASANIPLSMKVITGVFREQPVTSEMKVVIP